MDGLETIVDMLDYILKSKAKRHIIGGVLISASLTFGCLAVTVMTMKGDN